MSFASAKKYFQTFVAGFLSFVSTVLVWRGVWTAMDSTNLPWPFWIFVGTIGYSGLSLLQRSITKEKIKEREAAGEDTEEPVGNPFFSNDDFFRRGVRSTSQASSQSPVIRVAANPWFPMCRQC